jgi:hypothetical protein
VVELVSGDDEVRRRRSVTAGLVTDPAHHGRKRTGVGRWTCGCVAVDDDGGHAVGGGQLLGRCGIVDESLVRGRVDMDDADLTEPTRRPRRTYVVMDLAVRDLEIDDDETSRLWAASGAQWLTTSAAGVPGELVRRVAGLCAALDDRGCDLGGRTSAGGVGLLGERAALMHLPASGVVSAGGATQMVECADGWLAITLARPDDRSLVPAWLLQEVGGDDPWPAVHALARDRPVAELVDQAVLLGLACAAVGEATPGAGVRGERVGDAPPTELAGATVVSLASLWAGPLCADLLARMGARVITVESTRRPDGGRLARAFFEALHGRSESVALDLSSDPGRETLRDLLSAADVVIEGSRPRALEQMGIVAHDVVRAGPRVWVSITGHGRSAPARDRVGFGDDGAAAGGLVADVGGRPHFVADAVADPLTGLAAAVSVAELLESGGRWIVDAALAQMAAAVSGGWIASGHPPARPRPPSDPGRAMPLGRDTDAVLASLGIAPPDRR